MFKYVLVNGYGLVLVAIGCGLKLTLSSDRAMT